LTHVVVIECVAEILGFFDLMKRAVAIDIDSFIELGEESLLL
jgi:hypothetical protein